MKVVILTKTGVTRVHKGQAGMVFIIQDEIPLDHSNKMQLVIRDYRYPSNFGRFTTWALWPEDYEEVKI
jgi:hypothetical protein